ncbi:hypothetical protein ACH5RR_039673 [Cinchona calisaya]|uniref:Uncharacterized protein n=1 Tax=Cinchona calisaya TaxID=153742 RepID=A0ABD2Y303_9GENT
MATSSTYTCAFPVNSLSQRPTFNHVKASLSSSIKQSVKESPRIPNLDKSSVSEMVNKTSIKLLNAFVDLAFQFVDQEAIPSRC